MRLRAPRRVCHYCEAVHKLGRDDRFKPHSVLVGTAYRKVPSRDIEPSLRDPGPWTMVPYGVWKVCHGSERKPWAMSYV